MKIKKEQHDDRLIVQLQGPLENSFDFERAIGPVKGELVLACSGVPRINSEGVKAWIQYFESLKEKGTQFSFIECSPAVVQQISAISNFACGGKVKSIQVPYVCTKCRHESVVLFETADLKKSGNSIPDTACPKCGGQSVFDDVEEEFFAFLKRS